MIGLSSIARTIDGISWSGYLIGLLDRLGCLVGVLDGLVGVLDRLGCLVVGGLRGGILRIAGGL